MLGNFSGIDSVFAQKKASKFTQEQKTSLKKFSFAYAIIILFPLILLIAFALIASVKLNYIKAESALFLFLVAVSMVYFILPKFAVNILSNIIALAEIKKKKKVL
jgi:arginine exporter protein ArgO